MSTQGFFNSPSLLLSAGTAPATDTSLRHPGVCLKMGDPATSGFLLLDFPLPPTKTQFTELPRKKDSHEPPISRKFAFAPGELFSTESSTCFTSRGPWSWSCRRSPSPCPRSLTIHRERIQRAASERGGLAEASFGTGPKAALGTFFGFAEAANLASSWRMSRTKGKPVEAYGSTSHRRESKQFVVPFC